MNVDRINFLGLRCEKKDSFYINIIIAVQSLFQLYTSCNFNNHIHPLLTILVCIV